MTKVHIEAFGHIITVETDAELEGVAAKALELWRATGDPPHTRGPGAAGFTSERSGADGTYSSGYDHS